MDDALLRLRFELARWLLDVSLHDMNNRLTEGTSRVALLRLATIERTGGEHLDALGALLERVAERHALLLAQLNRLDGERAERVDAITCGAWLDRLEPWRELIAHHAGCELVFDAEPRLRDEAIAQSGAAKLELLVLTSWRAHTERGGERFVVRLDKPPAEASSRALVLSLSPVREAALEPSRRALIARLRRDTRFGAVEFIADEARLEVQIEAYAEGAEEERSAPRDGLMPSALRSSPSAPERSCLIVDDDAAMIKPLSRLLKYHGYRARAFLSSDEALRALDGGELDEVHIALIDYAMSERNGVETLRALRARRPTLPAILITGLSKPPSLEEFAGQSHTVTLKKPWRMQELLRLLEELAPRPEGRA